MSDQYRHRLLIVDDNPQNIRVAASTLKSENLILGFAESGAQALERLQEHRYDLILMDVMMPEMDGFETSRHIKALTEYQHIPIIFVTAKTADEDVMEGFYSGGVDYVTKPFNSSELWARVNTHLMLKSYRDRLEEKVREETEKRMVQQELLVRQSRMAAMGEMMAAITHQWNQPLTIVGMAADSIQLTNKKNSGDAYIEKQCKYIQDSIRFMAQTAQDFKSYFKPDKQMMDFCVQKEVDVIINMLAPQLKQLYVEPLVEIEEGLAVRGVASEFKQVILNLISNAKDAIARKTEGKEKGNILIRASRADQKIVFEIEDDGGGIPEDEIEKIFEDYYTSKGEKGTGIGLSMSKMIIEESFKGSIRAENREKGACFILELSNG